MIRREKLIEEIFRMSVLIGITVGNLIINWVFFGVDYDEEVNLRNSRMIHCFILFALMLLDYTHLFNSYFHDFVDILHFWHYSCYYSISIFN